MFSTFVGLGRFINCQRPDIGDPYLYPHDRIDFGDGVNQK